MKRKCIILLVTLALILGAAPTITAQVSETVPPPSSDGICCMRTPGYWKNHPEAWPYYSPNKLFFNSGQTWLEVLNTPTRGNPYYILAHAWIAAELNFEDSDCGVVCKYCLCETSWLARINVFDVTTPEDFNVRGNNSLRIEALRLAERLDEMNNGAYAEAPMCR